jgi:hypothetical protein
MGMSQRLREERRPSETRAERAAPVRDGEERYDRPLETRLQAMRDLLARVRPGSHAEALHALRAAFPGSSLSERVAVLTSDPRRSH